MKDDAELLREYARDGQETSFAELVRRHVGVVYGVAFRTCSGNAGQAEDVTQMVFAELARRSASLARHPALLGWLHTTTRFTAMKLIRSERRRQQREQQASVLHLTNASDPIIPWDRLRGVLDAALSGLKDRDRSALLLRFVEGKTLAEVAVSLRISETAARSCVDRALERLRSQLARHGITSTTSAVGLALANPAIAATPPGLAAAVTTSAMAAKSAGEVALASIFTMKKALIGAAAALAVVQVASISIALSERRTLDQEFRSLEQPSRTQTGSEKPNPGGAALDPAEAGTADIPAEFATLRQRLALLEARPAGVTDAAMRPPANVGRTTPQEAVRTLAWALQNRDLDTLAQFVVYEDDSAENRAAFMAHFSPAVQNRYKTPERLAMAFSFADELRDPPVAQQIVTSHQYHMGALVVTLWNKHESGAEKKTVLPLQETSSGWALTPLTLSGTNNQLDRLLQRVDPVSGDVLPLHQQSGPPRQ